MLRLFRFQGAAYVIPALVFSAVASAAFSAEVVKCVQAGLSNLGFQPGPTDGVLGRRSTSAANQFAERANLEMPELTEDTAHAWCDAVQEYASSPEAIASRDQTLTFRTVKWNGAEPSYEGSVVTLSLMAEQCGSLTYGDGRGESDCRGGRVRSQVQAPGSVRVGQEVEYYMEFFVPEDFSYGLDYSFPSRSRLLIAEWKRNQGIKNHSYEILLDKDRGATFERETCITEDEFGKWNSFSLRIKWSKDDDGYLEARCNGRLILERRGMQTVIPPDCASDYKLQCEPQHQKPNANILWSVGPNFSGYGSNFREIGKTSQFAPFPANGIELRVRNLIVEAIR